MGLTNYPNGVASFGIPQLGSGPFPFTTTGKVFFVHSGTGGDSPGKGTSPDTPFASLDYAVGRCTANKGDVIFAMPGHTETVTAAAGLDLDVAGISIVGLGSGSLRPTVNFTTATTADMDVDAANITLVNILFTAGFDALVAPIDVNAADFRMFDCELRDTTATYQTVDWIVATTAHRMVIDGLVFRGATDAGGETCISINGGDGIRIDNFDLDGNFGTAAIESVTTDSTNLKIGVHSQGNNYIRTRNSADIAITLTAASTGAIDNLFIRLADDAAGTVTECIVGADMNFGNNIYVANADGERVVQFDATASVG